MKKLSLFCLMLTCIGFVSCKKDQNPKDVEAAKVQNEKPISVECYKALYENDTIEMTVNTLKNGNITGKMVMKLFERPAKVGNIEGKFHGDTLFVDYSFALATNEKATFKNPLVMLKKDNKLILGSGKIETYLGRSFFAKGTPIEFDKVKYKFSKVECEAK